VDVDMHGAMPPQSVGVFLHVKRLHPDDPDELVVDPELDVVDPELDVLDVLDVDVLDEPVHALDRCVHPEGSGVVKLVHFSSDV
jgi:hypothetical protein